MNRLVHGRSLVCDRNGLAAFETGLHHATHSAIAGFFVAVLIAEVNLHSRDMIAESPQSALHGATNPSGQPFVTFDVMVRIDLDLHDISFV